MAFKVTIPAIVAVSAWYPGPKASVHYRTLCLVANTGISPGQGHGTWVFPLLEEEFGLQGKCSVLLLAGPFLLVWGW